MTSARSPWSAYRQVSMQTAAPGQVVLMLFDGAIRFLDRAEQGFEMEDPAEANQTIHNNIQRAQDIMHELNVALDLKNGGELATTLRGLYEYMDRRLIEANTRKSVEGIHECKKYLTSLREAWSQMLQGQPAPATASNLAAA